MKTALAVFVACIVLLVGWIFLGALLSGVGYIASQAREGAGLLHALHTLLTWILGPMFGGFLATFVTPQIFKDIDAIKLATSFIIVVITLAIAMLLIVLLLWLQGFYDFGIVVVYVIQVVAIVIGAKIGNSAHADSNT